VRILVSNDDGIAAPGLKVLERIARSLSGDVWTVAPEEEQSGASHSLTLHEPLRIRRLGRRRFAVRGTPTDCVMLALHHIIKGERPALVLSGVNRGANLGDDVTYSGTVAAAMEGMILGVPAVALSQVLRWGHPVKWATAEQHGPGVIRRLLDVRWPAGVLMNVNFPDVVATAVKGVAITVQGRRDISDLKVEERVDVRGLSYYWLGFRRGSDEPPKRNTDLALIHRGYISVTPLHLDLTHQRARTMLRKAFS